MTSIFLYCFYVGFGLTLVSVVLGMVDAGGGHGGDLSHGGDLAHGGHLSHAGDLAHGGHLPHAGDLAHGGDIAHGGELAHGQHGHVSGKIATVSPVNFQTIVAALMGFGGVGYLLAAQSLPLVAIVGAGAGALLTAWLIFRFQRLMARGERPMAPTSYSGLVGKLTVPIRTGGTGEVVYLQNDSRMVSAARSVDGTPIEKGAEVVILRYEKGVAYVQLWRDLLDQKTE